MLLGAMAGTAGARVVSYRGVRLNVPAGWPVYRLGPRSETCVRFDRHAVYLGTPSDVQRCPAHAVGRTEAVLISGPAHAGGVTAMASSGGSLGVAPLPFGLRATVTWLHHPGLIARILGRRPIAAPTASPDARPRLTHPVGRAADAIFTGPGFDACAAPSAATMAAWSQSPYRAVGVYIGGINSACAQPNLTPSWVAAQVAAGWRLIPTYVGDQGVGACAGSCARISSATAGAEGAAAAQDAIDHAQALGVPPGNPIYDDMEQYDQSSSHTAAVLAFLTGWTSALHAAGYRAGVYSSAASAVTDLVKQQGTGYLEPDDIWIGDWNGRATTSDPYVPADDWANHQRIHQYRGGHNERYGGVTLNIDSNDLDGDTAGSSGAVFTPAPIQVVPNGTFVSEQGSPTVYRVAGDAPLPVTSWLAFGGPQPVTVLTPQQWAELRQYPANGTFVQSTAEQDYRFAGGAAIAAGSTWSALGTPPDYTVIDQWDIANSSNPLAHVATAPADGTIVEGLPSRSFWRFAAGTRIRSGASSSAVGVADVGLSAYPVTPGFVAGAGVALPRLQCVVPQLQHMTLTGARRALIAAHCALGSLREPRNAHHRLHVYRQSAARRSIHPAGYRVGLWLL
ncbi:MAG: DUF1906 domain-containing protein [Solirubrobacterales bacterium]|nr:DUF1906 domain-containing protein [Solirubrobacterales bacterium]